MPHRAPTRSTTPHQAKKRSQSPWRPFAARSRFQRPLRTHRASPAKKMSVGCSGCGAVTLAARRRLARTSIRDPTSLRSATSIAQRRVLALALSSWALPLRALLPFGCAPSAFASARRLR